MLGEKRSQSLFAPKASAEKAAATHITTGPDGRKKELPLYFGPDCPVSGNMGQNQHEAGVGEPQPADEPLRHAPADDGTGVEADPTDSVNMAEDLPRRSLNTESAGGYRAHSLFFTPENEGQDFNTVLQDVQEYISGKYSALITEGGDEDAKAQIKRYITKYVQDRRIAVKGYSGDQLVDALYTEMAEFGLLTKYIFGTGIEEINVNSWRDIEVLYANGETVKLEEHFDSPEHAVNVIRRMLHVSGMVLDNASPAVLGHLSKNIRIAVLKTPLVDEDVGVTASIRIVLLETMKAADKDHRVFKLQFEAGEFDMVIYDQKENSCEIFEIKHSSKQVPLQYRHLVDEDKCQRTERRFGPIQGRYILYRGEDVQMENGVQYWNVENYLKALPTLDIVQAQETGTQSIEPTL